MNHRCPANVLLYLHDCLLLDVFEGIYDIQILVNMTYLLRGLWHVSDAVLGLGRRMTTPPEHSSRKHLRPQRDLNVLQCDTAFFFPPLWFLRVWWRSSSSFSFEDSFALKGFWSWTCLANPKCQYYFVLYVCVCVSAECNNWSDSFNIHLIFNREICQQHFEDVVQTILRPSPLFYFFFLLL